MALFRQLCATGFLLSISGCAIYSHEFSVPMFVGCGYIEYGLIRAEGNNNYRYLLAINEHKPSFDSLSRYRADTPEIRELIAKQVFIEEPWLSCESIELGPESEFIVNDSIPRLNGVWWDREVVCKSPKKTPNRSFYGC